MPKTGMERALNNLRNAWDQRARENARHFIATGQTDWSDEEFYASGETAVAHFILSDLENICQGRDPASMRVLEIGCGAGRVTRALARRFGEVHAVDISGEMVRLARATLADYPNAHVYQNSGADLSVVPDVPFDFVFSTIVFQHIDSHAIIESYVREVCRLLRPGRLFKFDVNGATAAPLSLAGRVIVALARNVVPKYRRIHRGHRNWVGRPYTPADAQELADKTGFELRYQDGAGSQNYWRWLFKR